MRHNERRADRSASVSRLSFINDILASVFAGGVAEDVDGETGPFVELCDGLLSERGEMAGNRHAHGILARFEAADEAERRAFFELLATRFDINARHALRAAERYAESASVERLERLCDAVEPRRLELLRRLNAPPGATVRLVRMRERLFEAMRADPDLARIDLDFRHLFRSWFNRGFLVLREIDWSTSANVLEKIIAYEAVHAIGDWKDLRSRLEPPDRRCFAFFHPAMPDEPLIFVEVALTRSNPAAIEEVLRPERRVLGADEVDTAVFYSISNCQKGLAGISFGNLLIKQVASELALELPGLRTFRTLSPVPGLLRWVDAHDAGDADAAPSALDAELAGALALARRIARGEADGAADEEERRALRRLTAHYVAREKRPDGQPLDPVARFHLGNGASLDDVLVGADGSARARSRSAGAMVSYLYDLERVATNHESYAATHEVATSGEAAAVLEPGRRTLRRRAS